MVIDDTLIAYLEELSRLRLTGPEKETAKADMGRILTYIGQLEELDTSGTEPLTHPFQFTNRFREDQVAEPFDREKLLSNAPRQKNGCFQAPRTVE